MLLNHNHERIKWLVNIWTWNPYKTDLITGPLYYTGVGNNVADNFNTIVLKFKSVKDRMRHLGIG